MTSTVGMAVNLLREGPRAELLSNCDNVVLLTFVGEFTYSSSREAGAAQAESI